MATPGHPGRGRRRLHDRVLPVRDGPGRDPDGLGPGHDPGARRSGRCRRSRSGSGSRWPAARWSRISSSSHSPWARSASGSSCRPSPGPSSRSSSSSRSCWCRSSCCRACCSRSARCPTVLQPLVKLMPLGYAVDGLRQVFIRGADLVGPGAPGRPAGARRRGRPVRGARVAARSAGTSCDRRPGRGRARVGRHAGPDPRGGARLVRRARASTGRRCATSPPGPGSTPRSSTTTSAQAAAVRRGDGDPDRLRGRASRASSTGREARDRRAVRRLHPRPVGPAQIRPLLLGPRPLGHDRPRGGRDDAAAARGGPAARDRLGRSTGPTPGSGRRSPGRSSSACCWRGSSSGVEPLASADREVVVAAVGPDDPALPRRRPRRPNRRPPVARRRPIRSAA